MTGTFAPGQQLPGSIGSPRDVPEAKSHAPVAVSVTALTNDDEHCIITGEIDMLTTDVEQRTPPVPAGILDQSLPSSSHTPGQLPPLVESNRPKMSRADSKEEQREEKRRRKEEKRLQKEARKDEKRRRKSQKNERRLEKLEQYDVDDTSDISAVFSMQAKVADGLRDDQASISDRSACSHAAQLPGYDPIWGDVEIDIMHRMILLEWVRAADKSHKSRVIVRIHSFSILE